MSVKFKVRALNAGGQVVSETVMANSATSAHQDVTARGLTPLEVTATGDGTKSSLFNKRISSEDIMLFFRQISLMLRNGITPIRALDVMAEQIDHPRLAAVVQDMSRAVENGSSLGEAFARHPTVFDPATISVVKATEQGAGRDEVLTRVADSMKANESIRKSIKSALTGPAISVIASFVLVALMMVFVVPMMTDMIDVVDGEMPRSTEILMVFSEYSAYGTIPLTVLSVAGWTWWRRNRHKETIQRAVDPFKLKIPVYGEMLRKTSTARALRNLALMLRNGVHVGEALEIVAPAAGNTVVADVLIHTRDQIVHRGKQLHDHISDDHVFPPIVSAMSAMGAESGSIPEMLTEIAETFEDQATAIAQRMASSLSYITAAVVGVLVTFISIALMAPMFSVLDGI